MDKRVRTSWVDYVHSFRSRKIDSQELNLDGLEQIMNFNKGFRNFFFHNIPIIYLLDFTTGKYIMMSKSSNIIVGYKSEYLMEAGIYFAFEKYHKDYLKTYSEEVFPDRISLLRNIPGNEHSNYIFSHNFKFKAANGEYKNLMQRCSYIKSDANNNPLISLGMIINLDHFQKDNAITELVEKFNDSEMECGGELISKKMYFLHEEDKIFSKREREVLLWMADGLTIKEIANKLYLSPYTVINHRRNMQEKTNTNNATELIIFAVNKGLI